MSIANKGKMFHQARRAVISASGAALPQKILSNYDLEKMVDTSDDWITTRTGIKERRIVSDGETTASLALQASRQALNDADLPPQNIDLIICATMTPEMVCPATACFIQQGLGATSACAFDLAAACSGFTYATATAAAFISSGIHNNALIVGAETLSNITDYTDRTSCILFGDGAGAILLQVKENTDTGVMFSSMHADGTGWETIHCLAHGSRFPVSKTLDDPRKRFIVVKGRETYQAAVRKIVELVEQACQVCSISKNDIALIIPHQSNARIIESVAKRLDVPEEKLFLNISNYGNTSAASIPIALDEALRKNRLKKGNLIVLVSFGAGHTWAINLIRL